MDMNQQIHSMKSKVSSIDLHALASTVRSMTEDLTSRGNVVINDSKRLYGIIDHCLTRSPFKKRHLKGHLPQQIVTVRWVLINAVIHRLAAEFDGTYSEGLPEEYMIEDVSMDVHGRYSDVVKSRLGKSTSPLRTESALESHA